MRRDQQWKSAPLVILYSASELIEEAVHAGMLPVQTARVSQRWQRPSNRSIFYSAHARASTLTRVVVVREAHEVGDIRREVAARDSIHPRGRQQQLQRARLELVALGAGRSIVDRHADSGGNSAAREGGRHEEDGHARCGAAV